MYEFKTKPFDHQARVFEETKDLEAHALLWEQGTGKTKALIDIASYNYLKGRINALMIVAPGGVNMNWVNDEIPTHMPDRVRHVSRIVVVDSVKLKQVTWQRKNKNVFDHEGLLIVVFTYDNFMTEAGKKFAWKLLQKRDVFAALDEAHYIKTPKAKRTKSIVASGKYPKMKRILTGTPISVGPFDVYSQLKYLDESFWDDVGCRTFESFKSMFGIFHDMKVTNGGKTYQIKKLIDYRNLDLLKKKVDSISDRVLKEDVLDLPEKVYVKRYFSASAEQWQLYQDLAEFMIVQLNTKQASVARIKLVLLLRFQQLLSGYLPVFDLESDEEDLIRLDDNPRLSCLLDNLAVTQEAGHCGMVWANFRPDIDIIMQSLEEKGWSAVRYDGAVSDEEAEHNRQLYKNGEVQFFVGNPAKGREGLTFVNTRTVDYYTNSFRLLDRLQSEDRAHRAGQKHKVLYRDYVGLSPEDNKALIDMKIVDNLRNKVDIASTITGDQLKEWI